MRILFITNTPPVPSWGGAMTFYRHFVERPDFTISVITDDEASVKKYKVPYPHLVVKRGKLYKRLLSSRFHLWMQTWDRTMGYWPVPTDVLEYAKAFKPDAIFTVAGSWQGMAILAGEVAKKLNIPLIGSFNDWWYYSATFHPDFTGTIEKKFRDFYRSCDLAICTSEGMRDALGLHPNAVILYPTGAAIKETKEIENPVNEKFTVAFGGSLADWYGKMMESLVLASKNADIDFKLYGGNPSWSAQFADYVKKESIYKGLIPFEQLQQEMSRVDALLLFMGFDKENEMIETTSFKTKFLDYLTFKKPIILWGPEYCSAVVIAREFGSAEICTSPDPKDFLQSILKVKNDVAFQETLKDNAYKMYEQRFNPDRLHRILVDSIRKVIENKKQG